MDGIIQFITDFLGTPAILIGVIILVGLLAQKKTADEVIRGTLKGILGFVIFSFPNNKSMYRFTTRFGSPTSTWIPLLSKIAVAQ